jgi:ribonuclease P protein component
MVKKSLRIPQNGFRERGYKTLITPYFSLKAKNNFLTEGRIGVVVGKSVNKSAARRNFWERQAKARLLLTAPKGKDIILTFSPKINTLTKAQFAKELRGSLQRLL